MLIGVCEVPVTMWYDGENRLPEGDRVEADRDQPEALARRELRHRGRKARIEHQPDRLGDQALPVALVSAPDPRKEANREKEQRPLEDERVQHARLLVLAREVAQDEERADRSKDDEVGGKHRHSSERPRAVESRPGRHRGQKRNEEERGLDLHDQAAEAGFAIRDEAADGDEAGHRAASAPLRPIHIGPTTLRANASVAAT